MLLSRSIYHFSVRSILPVIGLTVALTTCTIPSLARPVAPEVAPSPLSQRTLTMGTEADFIPFEYRFASDPPSGIIGFDIEVARSIARRLGFELRIQEVDFEQLLSDLRSGKFDFAMAALTPTEERRQFLDFSEAYFTSRNTLISPHSRSIRTLVELQGKRVAVQTSSVQEQAINQLVGAGLKIQVQPYARMNDIVAAVRDGTVDAALVEELVAKAYLENNLMLELNILEEMPPTPVAIAFPKGSVNVAAFNQALQEMKVSGELEQLVKQWFTDQP